MKSRAFRLALPLALNALLQVAWFVLTAEDFLRSRSRVVDPLSQLQALAYAVTCYTAIACALWLLSAALPDAVSSSLRARRGLLVGLSLIECALNGYVYFENRVFLLLGVHLNSPPLREALTAANFNREIHLDAALALSVAAVLLALFLVELLIFFFAPAAWDRLSSALRRRLLALVAAPSLALCALAAVALTATWDSIPALRGSLADLLPADTFIAGHPPAPHLVPDYPKTTVIPSLTRKPNVLLVAIESLRADAFGPELTPNLERYAREHDCIRPSLYVSNSHVTELSTFALLYALDAHHYEAFVVGGRGTDTASYPLRVLAANGYRVAGASASSLRHFMRADFLADQFSPYQEFNDEQGYKNDQQVVDFARRFHRTLGAESPSLLFAFLGSTHFDYSCPPAEVRYTPVVEDNWQRRAAGRDFRSFDPGIHNRYKNAVLHVDRVFGELIDVYRDDIARGDLALIVTGDHGEAFWDHGVFGHVEPGLESAAIRVPLMMCLPGVGKRDVPFASHQDVLPTLLDSMGPVPPLDEPAFTTGHSLLRAGLDGDDDRCALVTPQGYPDNGRPLCVVTPRGKYWLAGDAGAPPHFRVTRATDLDDKEIALPDPPPPCLAEIARRFSDFQRAPGPATAPAATTKPPAKK